MRHSVAGPGRSAAFSTVCLTAVALASPHPLAAQTPDAGALDAGALGALEWRHVGPVGNRISAVTGVPGDPDVYLVGAASGGVWKSVDGGHAWRPVFDDQPVQSIGALAVAPSDPDVVWAGTGEAHVRSNVSHGNGVYRSLDGGESWEHVGLEESGRVARIVIHPSDPDIVYVAALGHLYGPQEQRGVFRTRDGGESWERVLFVDENTGASSIVMMPDDPETLIAGMWTMLIRTWGRWSGGPNDGLYLSRDGGDTWERLEGNGLPGGTTGKIDLAVTPAASERVYALIETNVNHDFAPESEPLEEHEGVLWRSDDGADTWEMINADHTLVQRPHYYTRVVASPRDADDVYFMATLHSRSTDGGRTIRPLSSGDNHDMWIDPEAPDRMIVGNDQGVKISTNGGDSWYRPLLPVAQMYHVTVDTEVPYNLYGNRQDGPSIRGPSRTLFGGSIPIGEWRTVGGCESGWAVPDTTTNDVVWSGCYEGILDRHRISTGHSRTVSVWPDNPEGWPAAPLRYRFQWTFPIHVSPWDPQRVYVGSQHVHVTTNGGQSWQVLSPDLTTDDEARQAKSGGLTPDDVSPTYYSVLFAIAESPVREGVIWAGSNDGLVHVTRDGGERWTDVTGNLPGLFPDGTVSNIEPSPHDAASAWLTVDRHQFGDFDPYVYATTDYGATWERIDGGLPRSTHSFAHVVREDPVRPGMLYLGTHAGIWVSWDRGGEWASLQNHLPRAPVSWITVQPHFSDLVVSTYGRGFWILDDVTPLRGIRLDGGRDIVEPPVPLRLHPPRPTYRFLPTASPNSQPGDPAAGDNPPYGVPLTWWLAGPADDVEIEVLDASGEVVRQLDGPGEPGLNRIWWDLRYASSRTPSLRMPPLEHAHAWPEAPADEPMADDETRGPPEGGRVSVLAPPGTYTVRVVADGRAVEQPLELLMDPASEGTPATVAEQVEMLLELRGEVNRAADLIDALEWTRAELHRAGVAAGAAGADAVAAEAAALAARLREVEGGLFDLRLSGGTAFQDALWWPRRLWAKLSSLAGYVSGTDHRPTDQAREVHALYQERLADLERRWSSLRRDEIPALNEALEEAGLEPLAPTPRGGGEGPSERPRG
ncbi:MAG: hypothetical protein PVI57_17595 [Gemmatimonadota bacterium]|jgi:hypothetical protein